MEKDQTIKIDLLEDSHYFKTNQVIAQPPQSKSCMIRAGTTRTVHAFTRKCPVCTTQCSVDPARFIQQMQPGKMRVQHCHVVHCNIRTPSYLNIYLYKRLVIKLNCFRHSFVDWGRFKSKFFSSLQ